MSARARWLNACMYPYAMSTLHFDSIAFVAACKRAGLSTERLAQRAGISASYAGQLRLGRVPSADVRARIALALGVDEAMLWTASGTTTEAA